MKAYPVVLANLPDEVAKGLVDIDALLGRCLNELAAKVFGKVAALYTTSIRWAWWIMT